MDRILPIDLERAQLRKSLFGYRRGEADQMIAGAATTMHELLVENDRLRKELEVFRAEVSRSRAQEETLRDTLILAQRASDEMRAATQRSCDALLEEARLTAQQARQSAQEQLTELRWQIERLQADKKRFQDDLRLMLDRYRSGLNEEPSLTIVQGEATPA